jgi:hypothetical protein
MRVFRSCAGGAAVEGSEVEESAHERPAHWHICNKDSCASFTDVPECPHRREWVCEGVIFVEDGAKDLDCVSYDFKGLWKKGTYNEDSKTEEAA